MLFPNSHSVDIPEIFHSDEHKSAFSHCKLCEKELLESNTEYIIEKAFSKNIYTGKTAVVFEYAFCKECVEKFNTQISQESMRNMIQFFETHANLLERNQYFIDNDIFAPETWLQKCIINHSDISELEEYQISGYFVGNKLYMNHTPYMISGKALEAISNVLSKETKESMDDLWDKLIDLPSDVLEIFKRKPVLI